MNYIDEMCINVYMYEIIYVWNVYIYISINVYMYEIMYVWNVYIYIN